METIKLIKSQKGKRKIIYRKYIYNFCRENADFITWRCNRRGCSGQIKSDIHLKRVLFEKNHWHEEESGKIVRLEFNNKLKDIAISTTEGFDQAIIKTTMGMGQNDYKNLAKYNSIRDYYTRQQNQKIIPLKASKNEILEIYKFTLDNDLFLQHIDNKKEGENFLMFYTNENIEILERSTIWLGDATFYTAPKKYAQLYIIHGIYFQKVVPLCYILMENKNQTSYEKIFKYIKLKNHKEPEYFIVDFELAQYNAIKNNFANTTILGCNFHFSQIIIRYLQKSLFITSYKINSEYRKFVKYLLLLAYVPKEHVLNEFEKISLLLKDIIEYSDLYAYFYNQFIRNVTKNPTKQLEFWSVNHQILNSIPTTTNSCEAYHRYLNSKLVKKDPELGKIIDILKKEEKRNKIMISNLKSGKIRPKKDIKESIRIILLNYNFYQNFEFFEELVELINVYV